MAEGEERIWRSELGSRPATPRSVASASKSRYDYGALGPLMNLASRLSSQAAAGQVAVGQRVFAAVEEAVESVLVGDLELKGFGRPVTAYEIRGLR